MKMVVLKKSVGVEVASGKVRAHEIARRVGTQWRLVTNISRSGLGEMRMHDEMEGMPLRRKKVQK